MVKVQPVTYSSCCHRGNSLSKLDTHEVTKAFFLEEILFIPCFSRFKGMERLPANKIKMFGLWKWKYLYDITCP